MSEAEGLQATKGGWGSLGRVLALKRKLKAGQAICGAWLSLNDPVAAELLARVGFDFLLIDTEHGAWDLVTLQTTLMGFNGTDTVPIVRVPWNDHVRIKQALDMGVEASWKPMRWRNVAECRELGALDAAIPCTGRTPASARAAPSNYYRNIPTITWRSPTRRSS